MPPTNYRRAALRLRHEGDPVLRTPTTLVIRFDADLARLVEQMFEVMYAHDGVGLASNQVGVGLRLFVMDCAGIIATVVNPRELTLSGDLVEDDLEGCLSVPGHHYPTPRRARARLTGQDLTGTEIHLEAHDLAARCLQHEVDHLDGMLYLDRLTGPTRRTALRALRSHDHRPPHPT